MKDRYQAPTGNYVFPDTKEKAIEEFKNLKFICERSTVQRGDLDFTVKDETQLSITQYNRGLAKFNLTIAKDCLRECDTGKEIPDTKIVDLFSMFSAYNQRKPIQIKDYYATSQFIPQNQQQAIAELKELLLVSQSRSAEKSFSQALDEKYELFKISRGRFSYEKYNTLIGKKFGLTIVKKNQKYLLLDKMQNDYFVECYEKKGGNQLLKRKRNKETKTDSLILPVPGKINLFFAGPSPMEKLANQNEQKSVIIKTPGRL